MLSLFVGFLCFQLFTVLLCSIFIVLCLVVALCCILVAFCRNRIFLFETVLLCLFGWRLLFLVWFCCNRLYSVYLISFCCILLRSDLKDIFVLFLVLFFLFLYIWVSPCLFLLCFVVLLSLFVWIRFYCLKRFFFVYSVRYCCFYLILLQ